MRNDPASSSFANYQFKVIQELKKKVDALTNQLNESEKLRRMEQAKFVQEHTQKPLESVVATNTPVTEWNLPYIFEINSDNEDEIVKDEPFYLYIKDDKTRGLKSPGHAGYIKNDGPGNISYRINSGEPNKWSHPATLKNGEFDTFSPNDNVEMVVIEITADTDKTRFRSRFTTGMKGL